jgi:hypothetical protein
MEDKEFFDRALQLQAPWFVRGVKLDLQEKKVELEIGVEKGWRWKDSEGRAAQVHGWEEREWRHLNTMQCETTIRIDRSSRGSLGRALHAVDVGL